MRNLFKHLIARNAFFISIIALVLAGFEYLMCVVVTSLDLGGAVQYVMRMVPPAIRIIVEEQFLGGLTPAGFLAFAWNHPIALALGASVAIVLASRAVAGGIETGEIHDPRQ